MGIRIGNREIGKDCPPFIIAEMSGNHNQSLSRALEIVGATVIEKHFTLRRADGSVDSTFSLEPEEFQSLVTESRRAWQALGRVNYGPTEEEKMSLKYHRSLYVV